MISTLMHQLTRKMTQEEIIKAGFEGYFINHTAGVYPADTSGVPFDTKYIASNGDSLADIHEDLAADATTAKEQPLFSKVLKPLI